MGKVMKFFIAVFMIFSLSACSNGKADKLEKANTAIEDGDYETAETLLTELGDYENAKELLEEVQPKRYEKMLEDFDFVSAATYLEDKDAEFIENEAKATQKAFSKYFSSELKINDLDTDTLTAITTINDTEGMNDAFTFHSVDYDELVKDITNLTDAETWEPLYLALSKTSTDFLSNWRKCKTKIESNKYDCDTYVKGMKEALESVSNVTDTNDQYVKKYVDALNDIIEGTETVCNDSLSDAERTKGITQINDAFTTYNQFYKDSSFMNYSSDRASIDTNIAMCKAMAK